jgi:hypothetical protein
MSTDTTSTAGRQATVTLCTQACAMLLAKGSAKAQVAFDQALKLTKPAIAAFNAALIAECVNPRKASAAYAAQGLPSEPNLTRLATVMFSGKDRSGKTVPVVSGLVVAAMVAITSGVDSPEGAFAWAKQEADDVKARKAQAEAEKKEREQRRANGEILTRGRQPSAKRDLFDLEIDESEIAAE